jgi:hypothetical protein
MAGLEIYIGGITIDTDTVGFRIITPTINGLGNSTRFPSLAATLAAAAAELKVASSWRSNPDNPAAVLEIKFEAYNSEAPKKFPPPRILQGDPVQGELVDLSKRYRAFLDGVPGCSDPGCDQPACISKRIDRARIDNVLRRCQEGK